MLYEKKDIVRLVSKEFGDLTDREKDIIRESYSILMDEVNNDESFEIFWDKFHELVKIPKTDRARALKAWKKTTITDKRKAYSRIKMYASQKQESDHKYLRKACYYLSDELYKDELVPAGNTDSLEHANKLITYMQESPEWVSDIADTFTTTVYDVLEVSTKFIQRSYLAATLPTDIKVFKIKLIESLDRHYAKHNQTNSRVSKYQRLVNAAYSIK